MAEGKTYIFQNGSQNVEHIDSQTNNYYYGGKRRQLVTPEVLRKHIDLVLPFMTSSRHWFSVCKMMMNLGIVGEGDFVSAAMMVKAAYPEGLNVSINPEDIAKMNVATWKDEEPEKWSDSKADPLSKGVPTYRTIAIRFRDSF